MSSGGNKVRQIKLQGLSQVCHILLTFKYTLWVQISLETKHRDKHSEGRLLSS